MTLTLKMALRKVLLCCNKISSPQPIYRELLDYYETTWVELKIKQKESSKSFFFLAVVFVRIKVDVGLGRMCLFDFSSEKIQIFLFDQPSNPGAMDINDIDGWKIVFKMHNCLFLLLLKLPPRQMEHWCVLWSFFLLGLLFITINLLYDLSWNTVVMYRLTLTTATWICWISYKK